MDAIEPILPNPSILPEVRATQRVHRDGGRGDGAPGRQRRQRDQEEAVEVDVEGVAQSSDPDSVALGSELTVIHRIDLTADEDPLLPARRVDLTADGEGEPPARRIDLSA